MINLVLFTIWLQFKTDEVISHFQSNALWYLPALLYSHANICMSPRLGPIKEWRLQLELCMPVRLPLTISLGRTNEFDTIIFATGWWKLCLVAQCIMFFLRLANNFQVRLPPFQSYAFGDWKQNGRLCIGSSLVAIYNGFNCPALVKERFLQKHFGFLVFWWKHYDDVIHLHQVSGTS